MDAPLERKYTLPEIASAWGTTYGAVRQLVLSGRLRGRKIGGIWRVSPAALAEYEAGADIMPSKPAVLAEKPTRRMIVKRIRDLVT